MHLRSVSIQNVRRIESAEIELDPSLNIFVGPNGSGKTSILEALYLLSGGRSFRTARVKEIIRRTSEHLVVSGLLSVAEQTRQIGVEKTPFNTRLRMNGENIKTASEVVRELPILVLNGDSFRLLEGGPSNRRDLVDRLLFHVEQPYLDCLRKYYQILGQRNAALRKSLPGREIALWDEPLTTAGNVLDGYRVQQVAALNIAINKEQVNELVGKVDLKYESGWNKGKSLGQALGDSLNRDKQMGTTNVGPHRGELKIEVAGVTAKSSLSRGQTKLVVTGLIAAMAESISQATGKTPLLLVDDLASELDSRTKSAAIQLLMGLKTQALLTAIEYNMLSDLGNYDPKVFHVEQGRITNAA